MLTSGTNTLGSRSSTDGQTIFLCISRSRSKFLSHFILSSSSLSEFSSHSIICVIISRSPKSSVLISISFKMSGTLMICWTGDTSRSVSCNFLHRGSRLHHYIKMKNINIKIWQMIVLSNFWISFRIYWKKYEFYHSRWCWNWAPEIEDIYCIITCIWAKYICYNFICIYFDLLKLYMVNIEAIQDLTIGVWKSESSSIKFSADSSGQFVMKKFFRTRLYCTV